MAFRTTNGPQLLFVGNVCERTHMSNVESLLDIPLNSSGSS